MTHLLWDPMNWSFLDYNWITENLHNHMGRADTSETHCRRHTSVSSNISCEQQTNTLSQTKILCNKNTNRRKVCHKPMGSSGFMLVSSINTCIITNKPVFVTISKISFADVIFQGMWLTHWVMTSWHPWNLTFCHVISKYDLVDSTQIVFGKMDFVLI